MKVRILSLVIGLIALSSFAFAQEEMMGNVEEPIAAGTEEIIDTTLIQNKFCQLILGHCGSFNISSTNSYFFP